MNQRLNHLLAIIFAAFLTVGIAACNGSSDMDPQSHVGPVDHNSAPPSTKGRLQAFHTDALVFSGTGVWSTEQVNLESMLTAHGKTYQEVTQAGLNVMTAEQIAGFGMILWPGGSGTSQMSGLTEQAKANIRKAVQEYGVSYIGFCAGAFAAVSPMDVLAGPTLDYYYLEYEGIYSSVVETRWADGATHHLLWYGGPVTPEGTGIVLARYADTQEPAVSQIWSGRGLVIITGPHPGVPQSVASSLGLQDPDGSDAAITWTLLNATLNQQPLTAF